MTASRTSTALLAGAALAAALLGGCKKNAAESPATPAADTSGKGTTPDTGGTGTAVQPANNAGPGTGAGNSESGATGGSAATSGGAAGMAGNAGSGAAAVPGTSTPAAGPSGSAAGTSGTVPDRDDNRSNSTRERRPTN